MIKPEAQRVNIIVYNKNLEFLVHKQPRQSTIFYSDNTEYTLGLWADVEELHAHEHGLLLWWIIYILKKYLYFFASFRMQIILTIMFILESIFTIFAMKVKLNFLFMQKHYGCPNLH